MIKLKPSEIRFWQDLYLMRVSQGAGSGDAAGLADWGLLQLRARLEDPGPRPDEGRL